jgi:hypothetical protein
MNITISNPGAFFSDMSNLFSSSAGKNTQTDEDIEAGDSSSLLGQIKTNIKESIEVKTSYKWFLIIASIGFLFVFLSLLFLPFVAINPQKFLTLFSIGSILILSSFIFIYGTTEYFRMLFTNERFVFTSVYIVSILLGLYSAYVKNLYILSFICVLIQIITLVIFTLSFIPGGKSGISFILNMLITPVKRLFNN